MNKLRGNIKNLKLLGPFPEKVTVFEVGKTYEQGATDVYKWQEVASKLPKGIFNTARANVVNGSRPWENTILIDFIGLLGQTDIIIPLMNKNFLKWDYSQGLRDELGRIRSFLGRLP